MKLRYYVTFYSNQITKKYRKYQSKTSTLECLVCFEAQNVICKALDSSVSRTLKSASTEEKHCRLQSSRVKLLKDGWKRYRVWIVLFIARISQALLPGL